MQEIGSSITMNRIVKYYVTGQLCTDNRALTMLLLITIIVNRNKYHITTYEMSYMKAHTKIGIICENNVGIGSVRKIAVEKRQAYYQPQVSTNNARRAGRWFQVDELSGVPPANFTLVTRLSLK